MTNARQDGFYLLLLGSLFFVAIGALMAYTSSQGPVDFQGVWDGSRCLLEHRDMYQPDALWTVDLMYGNPSSDPAAHHLLHLFFAYCANLPTTLVLVVPLAVLSWKLAEAIWIAMIAVCFILACFCVWSFGAESTPRIFGALIFLLMINSGWLLCTGNTAGLVVSLTVIAVFCFIQERFVPAGIVCLAISLVIKPHDSALVWLYFLLAGGVERRRALQTLALAVALAVPAILWVSHVAPHWPQELHANLLKMTSPGGQDYAGPATGGALGVDMIISLQAALSLIRDDPNFSNPVAYCISGVLLLIWSIKTVRSGFSRKRAWLALAAISALTMLPTYHRAYDARLLLLTIPACAILWKKGGPVAWGALLLTVAGIVITGDIFWIAFFQFTGYSYNSALLGMIPAPLVLLAVAIFYLIVYLKQSALPEDCEGSERRQIEPPLQAGSGAVL